MVLLILNFIGNIGRYRLWKKKNGRCWFFTLAFVLIFIGGAITRYISLKVRCTSEKERLPMRL
jgi:hypothetical protein